MANAGLHLTYAADMGPGMLQLSAELLAPDQGACDQVHDPPCVGCTPPGGVLQNDRVEAR